MDELLNGMGQELANLIPDDVGGVIVLLNEGDVNDNKSYYLSNLPKERLIEELRILADAIESNDLKKNPYNMDSSIKEDAKIYDAKNKSDE